MSAPTLRDVARAAGVSLASASYALRRHPTVSVQTHQHVAAVAEKLGYRLNPQLAAFMQARRVGRTMRRDATIGVVHSGPPEALTGVSYFGTCLQGVRAVAAERGYAVDAVGWHPGRKDEAGRLQRVLEQRGIRGLVLVPPSDAGHWVLPLDWTRFFGVTLDYSLAGAPVHRVTDHHAADMLTALQSVRAAGFRRPGLVLTPLNNERTRDLRLGAFLAWARRESPAAPPPLLVDTDADQETRVRAWAKEHRPDVVLSPDGGLGNALRTWGIGGPGKAGFVCLAQYAPAAVWPGMVIDGEAIGRTAGFLLMSLLEDARSAASPKPQTILLENAWQGRTSLHARV